MEKMTNKSAPRWHGGCWLPHMGIFQRAEIEIRNVVVGLARGHGHHFSRLEVAIDPADCRGSESYGPMNLYSVVAPAPRSAEEGLQEIAVASQDGPGVRRQPSP